MNSIFGGTLKNYEPNIEGSRQFMIDHENDPKMQNFFKTIKDEWKISDEELKGRMECLILSFIKMEKDMGKISSKETFERLKNNFFKLTQNEFDLRLINNIFDPNTEKSLTEKKSSENQPESNSPKNSRNNDAYPSQGESEQNTTSETTITESNNENLDDHSKFQGNEQNLSESSSNNINMSKTTAAKTVTSSKAQPEITKPVSNSGHVIYTRNKVIRVDDPNSTTPSVNSLWTQTMGTQQNVPSHNMMSHNHDLTNCISLELEQDTGLIAFQQAFYKKYSIIYYSVSEKEKASMLKIRMLIKEKEYIDITRDELDLSTSKFRNIYKSFFALKTHLELSEMKNFDFNFNFENFMYINKMIPEYLYLDQEEFCVKWISSNRTVTDEQCKKHIKAKIFTDKFVQLNRDSLFNPETTTNQIVVFLCKKHFHFVEFMLKVYRADQYRAYTASMNINKQNLINNAEKKLKETLNNSGSNQDIKKDSRSNENEL